METRRARRPFLGSMAIWIAGLLISTGADAVELRFLDQEGQYADLDTCGIGVSASAALDFDFGLGVAGGASSSIVDGIEWIEFELDVASAGVYFDVSSAVDLDGDGAEGRAIVEAFDGVGASLGIQMIQDTGRKDLASLFGSSAIGRVVVTALADGMILSAVGYSEAGPVEIDLRNSGQYTYSFNQRVCGADFDGSNAVALFDDEGPGDGGLGIYGGYADTTTDGSQWIRIDFPYPVDELSLESLLFTLDGDANYGEGVLFAYDEFGMSLGSTSIHRHTLFGNGPIAQTLDVVDRLEATGIASIEIYSLGDA